jgi:hypothetical protein
MVYKFSDLDAKKMFLDIAILEDDTFRRFAQCNQFLHILTEWKWPLIPCDETWNQEERFHFLIPVMFQASKKTSDTQLSDILNKQNTKILYVYDFINMWTFLVCLLRRRSSCWEFIS